MTNQELRSLTTFATVSFVFTVIGFILGMRVDGVEISFYTFMAIVLSIALVMIMVMIGVGALLSWHHNREVDDE